MIFTSMGEFKNELINVSLACSRFLDVDISDEEVVYISGLIPRTISIDSFYKMELNGKKLTYLTDMLYYFKHGDIPWTKESQRSYHQYIGDYCLLVYSLFDRYLNRKRRADLRDFYINCGKSAYKSLSTLIDDELFGDLSHDFKECSQVIKHSLDILKKRHRH
ncbi:MAG: hypothetical protein ACMUJM_09785 [bacterium]